MPHLPLSSRSLCQALLAAVVFCATGEVRSQSSDGFTVQERPGIAIVKPQPWSKESDATVMEFLAFIDRTASGAAKAGYFEFRMKSGDKRQVPTSKLVKMVVYADPAQIREIVDPEQRQALQNTINEFKGIPVKFPATRTYVEPSLKKLEAEAAMFDGGKVKAEGVWITKQAYVKAQAANLIELLKAETDRALPPGSFDLEQDPKYLALLQFSATDPNIKILTEELASKQGKLSRTEKRKTLLTRLADPALGMPSATEAVSQLKALKPEEDPKSAAFLKLWDAGKDTVKATSEDAAKLAASLEGELASNKIEEAPPQLSPDLDAGISALNEKMILFTASKPPVQLLTESRQALAVCAAWTGFKKLKTIFAEKHFIEAKDLLDDLSRRVQFIGSETSQVITALQQFTATKIDEFTRLREQAKLLADSGKKAEALVKYQDAYAVIPDNAVGDEIAKLMPETPAPPK